MKTNHKITVMQILLAVLCGLVLAVHRRGADAGMGMFLVGLAAAAVLLFAAFGTENLRKKLQLKPAEPDKLCFAMLAAAGFLFLLCAVLFLLVQEQSFPLRVITAVFFAFSGVTALLRLPLRDSGKTAAVYSLIPVFALSFYLLTFYRSNGDNPYLSSFGYEMAVLLTVLLGVYASVAGRFEKPHPVRRVAMCSVALCLTVQEGCAALLMTDQIFTTPGVSLGTMVMLMACGLLLCCGMGYPSVREVFEETPKDDQPEEE